MQLNKNSHKSKKKKYYDSSDFDSIESNGDMRSYNCGGSTDLFVKISKPALDNTLHDPKTYDKFR